MGELSKTQIEDLLHQEIVGRIGCHNKGTTYIVPVSYAYDGTYIYVRTFEGMKIHFMRQNPAVCFQVDHLENMGNWQSVIAWGTFEELPEGADREKAVAALMSRPLPLVSSSTTHLSANWPFTSNDLNDVKGIVFRIQLVVKTGRYEQTSYSH